MRDQLSPRQTVTQVNIVTVQDVQSLRGGFRLLSAYKVKVTVAEAFLADVVQLYHKLSTCLQVPLNILELEIVPAVNSLAEMTEA